MVAPAGRRALAAHDHTPRRDVVRRWLQGHRRAGMDLRIDDRSETTSMPAILGPGAKHAFTAVLSGEIEQALRPGAAARSS